jgi:glycosyltransferase involved in cell wall biosynthesis
MISVCLASYNGARYIGEQLRSILDQLGPGDEVVVSDDASTDDTVAVVRAVGDARIRVFENSTNLGYTRNFENALRQARGDLIFLADQDDVWLDGKVSTLERALRTADFVVSDARVVDGDLNELHASHGRLHHARTGFWANFSATRYIGACMAFRRDVLTRALPFPSNAALCAHDYWLAIVAERWFRTRYVDVPLILYRRHGSTASTGGDGSLNSLARKVLVRLYCGAHLLTHQRRK